MKKTDNGTFYLALVFMFSGVFVFSATRDTDMEEIGVIFIAFAVVMLFFFVIGAVVKAGHGTADLVKTGLMIEATVTKYGKNVNDDKYHLEAMYYDPNNGSKRIVKTPPLDFDPTLYVVNNNKKIIVYVNPKNPSNYYINTVEIGVPFYELLSHKMGGNTPPKV